VAYNAARQLLAWTEGTSSASVYLVNLATPGRRIELRSDVHGLEPWEFSDDGSYLIGVTEDWNSLRVWKVETGQIVASVKAPFRGGTFAAAGRVLALNIMQGFNQELQFYDLSHPDQVPRRHSVGDSFSFAVSPDCRDGAGTSGGLVQWFDCVKGDLIESVRGHLNSAFKVAFSPDGRRLISTSGGQEAVKLWDVGTRQELLTLGGSGSLIKDAQWSADGDVIFAFLPGPWQVWRAPSWEEIDAAEAKNSPAKEKTRD
jgi:WD40 repeat protein